MNQFSISRKSLEDKICELEETLTHLKQQLQKQEEADQHKAIDNLDQYLGAIDSKYNNLKDFWQIVRQELAELFSNNSNDHNKT
ncbi:MAG: hypothetical protein V2J55_17430 [Candidatus Competibacteraceae bacterium]|jgi:hypothetical protein|nr:hypothetical protein [Candidatus Competibacteraceae bacterium]